MCVQVAQHFPTVSTSYGDWITEKRQSTGKSLTPETEGGTHEVVSAHNLACQGRTKPSIFYRVEFLLSIIFGKYLGNNMLFGKLYTISHFWSFLDFRLAEVFEILLFSLWKKRAQCYYLLHTMFTGGLILSRADSINGNCFIA